MRACLFVLLLAGCASAAYTTIDYSRAPPADWPTLREYVYDVAPGKLLEMCRGTPNADDTLRGCTKLDFGAGWCAIVLPEGHPDRAALLAHERGHCAGRNHSGDTFTTNAWERYKAQRR